MQNTRVQLMVFDKVIGCKSEWLEFNLLVAPLLK